MKRRPRLSPIVCLAVFSVGWLAPVLGVEPAAAGRVDYNRDIRTILSDACFRCHGPDEGSNKAGLRLDVRELALAPGKSGKPPIVPGRPELSGLVRRVFTHDEDDVMPRPESNKSLTDGQKELLRRWIHEGAEYAPHWAFVPPRKVAPPTGQVSDWPRGPLDHFILARLCRENLSPAPEAERHALIRRASFDLTGLPPTPEAVEAFLADRSPQAYEQLIDRLLGSDQFGERMAQMWLDLARFADSDGYHDDTTRSMWQFRDYVIRSFNDNKPFDQFTIEQLAGDLLPDASLEQMVGSAFHRNGPTSSEGGADASEYAARYAVDRVNTTATTWLGVTLQCAECHNHKFDPFTTREFYQMFAFFDQVPEDYLMRALQVPPVIPTPTKGQESQLADMAQKIAVQEAEIQRAEAEQPQRLQALQAELEQVRKARDEFAASIPRLRVMADVPERRPTHILVRGDFRVHGDEVQPGVPASLGHLPEGMRPDRLALAKWLTAPDHPLTARVMVNRLWQMVFGVGLVKTAGEFGSQGELPSHPELLDWLAVDFVESGWDVKHVLRQILTSATYRQSSGVSAEQVAHDPENRLLARGPRFRLPAEFLRDNALAIAGLLDLDRPVGGPSVKPYQPGDLWREFAYGDTAGKSYVRDRGPDLYRRGIYTFWKRSVLHPGLALFDAPNREVCTAHRPVTNTPLQAYVLLNDETYVEAARMLAERAMEAAASFDEQLRYAFVLAVARPPTGGERDAMRGLFEGSLAEYRGDPAAAELLLQAGDAPRAQGLDLSGHAAWTCVANAILNFDETLTKE